MSKVFGIVLFLISSFSVIAQSDTVLLEDLRYGWIKTEGDEVVPVVQADNEDLISFSLLLRENQVIRICNDQPFDVWINLEMISHQETQCLSLEINEVSKISSDSLFIQISSANGLSGLKTELYHIVPGELDDLSLRDKPVDYFHDFFLVNVLALIFIGAVFRRFYPRRFSRVLSNPLKSRSLSTLDDFYSDFFGADNIIMMLFFSVLTSFCLTYLGGKYYILGVAISSWGGLFVQQSVVMALILALIILKYILSVIFSLFFHFREVSNVQGQDFMNFFSWLAFFTLFLASMDFSVRVSDWPNMNGVLAFVLVIALLIFQVGVYFKIDKLTSHKKIMIISYLCTTEFIPGFILIYLLVK